MRIEASSVDEYISKAPADRQRALHQLRETISRNIPEGFEEALSYGVPGWVVPLSRYPDGYHCDPTLPLPFLSFASQKRFIGLYHMGIYADPQLLSWFQGEYPKHVKTKLDMGKSCIRFQRVERIPYALIAELVRKVSVDAWIAQYEAGRRR